MSLMADLKDVSPEAIQQQMLDAAKNKVRRERQARREVDAEDRPSYALDFYDDAALDARPAANWLVHGLILEGSLGVMVGEPGSFKTFCMLDLALSIASGQPSWLGRKLTRQGAVVYVAAEGQGRFKYRKNVWKQAHGITTPLPFYTLTRAVDLRDQDLMAAFLKSIEAWAPVAVMFDTLSRCIPGAEENSAKELGEAIAACNVIQQATGATVQLLHHPRKDGASSRGSSAGLGAVESELWMKKTADKGLFTLTCGKQKEGDDELIINLKRRIVELEGLFESDGEAVTSCVIELADAADLAKANVVLARRIVDFVSSNPNTPKGDVSKHLGMQKKKVDAAIAILILDGALTETQGGITGRAKLLNVPSASMFP